MVSFASGPAKPNQRFPWRYLRTEASMPGRQPKWTGIVPYLLALSHSIRSPIWRDWALSLSNVDGFVPPFHCVNFRIVRERD